MNERSVIKQIEGLIALASAPWCVKCHEKLRHAGHGWYCVFCPVEFTDPPWCIKCHSTTRSYGHDRNGFRRWMCYSCSVVFSNQYLSEFDIIEGSIRKAHALAAAIPLFQQGLTVRTVGDLVGVSKHTAMKFRRIAMRQADCRCKCGQSAGHRGFCWWRYQNSSKRQEFMKRWHSKAA